MVTLLKKIWRQEEGASLVEYGLLVALIAAVCIVAVGILGGTINGVFENINAALAGAGV